ncbi:MAG: amino acid ABC transporter substrate-binding protein [Proteobacteria bacterium]|nr:amino acid ABC transporter substrate-binding protein [Pseudomonadota bacterium]MBI3497672.1 amino acid ABC transporter substrate-binding protein [Pseudomonadota bacterium]
MTERKIADLQAIESTGAVDRRQLLTLAAGLGAGSLILSHQALAQAGAEDTYERIKRTGAFNLGAREATPPYGFKDKAGTYVGFATDMARAVHANLQKELGVPIKLNYIPVTSQTRIPLLQNGTIDMEAGATTVTRARRTVVEFPVAHFVTATALLVATDGPIHKVEDLGGKRVGIPLGGVSDPLFRGLNQSGRIKPACTIVGFPDHPQAFTALETGSIEAYAVEGPIGYGLRSKSTQPAKWRVFDANVDSFLQAFPIRPDSPKFKRVVDLTLVNLFASGEWGKLYDTYFGPKSDAPLPMTDALRTLEIFNSWPEQ